MKQLSRFSKTGVVLGSVVLALGVVTGCSSDSSPAPSSDSPSPTGPAPTVSADPTLAARVPQKIKDSGTHKVATDPGSAPMVFGSIDNPQGIDPDLARAVASTLGLKSEFASVPFAQIRDNIAAGTSDVGWSVTTVTPERLKQVDFVTYYNAGKAWLVKSGSTFDPNNLCGQKIASIDGYLYTTEAQDASKACTISSKAAVSIKIVSTASDGRAAVESGEVAAFPVDSPIAESMIANSNGSLARAGEVTQVAPLGAVIAQGSELGPVVRDAVQKLIDGGQYKQIVDRWQVPSGAISESKLETSQPQQ